MIRSVSLTTAFVLNLFLLIAVPLSRAQDHHSVAIEAEYTWMHTNLLPGCNCFGMYGGSGEAEVSLTRRVSVLGDITAAHQSSLTPSGYALTQVVFAGGLRYAPLALTHAWLRPFGEALIGGAHTSGTLSPSNGNYGGDTAFAFQTGGGVRLPLSRHLDLVPVHADYLLTNFGNGAANRQNQLRLSIGMRFNFRRKP